MHAAYYSLLVPRYKISTWMVNHLRVVHNKMDRFLYIMSTTTNSVFCPGFGTGTWLPGQNVPNAKFFFCTPRDSIPRPLA